MEQAVSFLRAGRLVAFPTETVYGLGADARNGEAVRRIFVAKGRPSTNPLIVHVSGVAMAKVYARQWTNDARLLGQAFWPGPLTLVLPKHKSIVSEVSAGRDTIGLRVPNHPLAIELIRRFDGPLAAPSANRSTHVSPTAARHVRDELGDGVALILDGGPCSVGIESTVLDLSDSTPRILRPGAVTREQIERVLKKTVAFGDIFNEKSGPAKSPGQHQIHYAPTTPAYRFENASDERLQKADVGVIRIGLTSEVTRASPFRVTLPNEPKGYAKHLYAVLREMDQLKLRAIYIQSPPAAEAWLAVGDRIRRATLPLP